MLHVRSWFLHTILGQTPQDLLSSTAFELLLLSFNCLPLSNGILSVSWCARTACSNKHPQPSLQLHPFHQTDTILCIKHRAKPSLKLAAGAAGEAVSVSKKVSIAVAKQQRLN